MTTEVKRFPIVGVGASAGGIPALEALFKGLETVSDMAFVIVTHLNPDRQSLLHEVITRYTRMPVSVTQNGERVESGHVYVMPENSILTIEDGRLQIRRPNVQQRERKPIDIFFSSLAKDEGEYAIGIILSGGDSDGTLGVKAIKEYGGLTLAQAPDGSGPRNPDMPASAIGSGLIDLALPAEEMGDRLREFGRGLELVDGLVQDQSGDAKMRRAQAAIFALLRSQSGHDFSGYKTKTFLRRVHRRMQVVQVPTIEDYVVRLRRDPAELMLLFRDLLINVTNFFRDAEAFDALATIVVPSLFQGRGAADTIRIWVPGCATGEEVYSIAILMCEHLENVPVVPRIQIFATDIDDAALGVARAARYPEALLDGVSEERRQRFFTDEGNSYVVNKQVREMCIFSPHSVIRDPPFSRMDLVSCRNLLIYFGPAIQNQVVPTFHYALKPGGFLFLGTSEGISHHADLFSTMDKKHRIFQRREHASRLPRLPSTIGNAASDHSARIPASGFPLRQVVEAQVLDRFAPAHVVVNGDGDVIYYSARTGQFLEAPQGAPSRQLLAMARRGLRLDLRSLLREATETRQPVTRDNIAIEEDGDRVQPVTITVEPLAERGQGEPLYLVLFTPSGPVQSRDEAEHGQHGHDSAVADLEQELRDTRERLQSTIEEYETSLEELKSSNEELVSVNEEAQSTNEELEASKEEMQSLNEELNTINAELGAKVEELDGANSDLRNLFESTQIATVFLDRNLVIRNYTPAASAFFKLLPADIGRPLTDLASNLDYPELNRHIQQVFEAGQMLEHTITREKEARHFLVRLVPYRDAKGKTEGVVVAFVDVTTLADAEEHQKVLIEELNHRVKNMLAVVINIIRDGVEQAPTLDDFAEALTGRMQSMARAYGTLSRENWTEVQVDELIRQELEPFGTSRITLSGPAVQVNPQTGLSISMVLHELFTNARRFGALSTPEGRVEVSWSVTGDQPVFHLGWVEHGGPNVAPPDDKGLGLRLVRGEIEYRLGGKVDVDFAGAGLDVQLQFPLGK